MATSRNDLSAITEPEFGDWNGSFSTSQPCRPEQLISGPHALVPSSLKQDTWGAWVAPWFKHLPSAQVMIPGS